jgi:hypothetical protein
MDLREETPISRVYYLAEVRSRRSHVHAILGTCPAHKHLRRAAGTMMTKASSAGTVTTTMTTTIEPRV